MPNERVERQLRISRVLFVALLMSIGIYAVIAYMVTLDPQTPAPQPELAHDPLSQPLVLALGGCALMMLAVTPFVRMKLLPPREHGDKKLAVGAALSRLTAAQIITWALTEVPAIFGLMLTMLSYEPRFTYAFSGVSALAMLAYAPHRKLVEDVVRVADA